ncbi:MAG: family 20 glycosylhydrolase [Akkermansiaceae bacterium]
MKPILISLFLSSLAIFAETVPAVQQSKQQAGEHRRSSIGLFAPKEFATQENAFAEAMQSLGIQVKKPKLIGKHGSAVTLIKGELPAGSNYRIEPHNVFRDDRKGIKITANTKDGAAQAFATVLQQLRLEGDDFIWPNTTVTDGPDQEFRCFMVDMGRNPHSPKSLRHVIDTMWFYKANYLQLHLTDDQLFSWPSKAFPKLYSEHAGWTWKDFEDLEAYAQARGVTIIPEMDVPGHSGILRGKYPEVFGKTPTDLATKPEAQKGVETLIDEMLSVFKSTPYYHMGGDEAYGVPQDAQRNFINRINTFVKSRKKQLIVWEGPHLGKGDNKVSTDVIHMIWRNTEVPAQVAIDEGYPVINASWDPLYIVDHYPRTMFTAVDVERCYKFDLKRWAHINHGFQTFKNPHITKNADRIMGFCMPWWEGREENILPLCVERIAATSAAAWNKKGENDFAAFQKRQERLLPRLEKISGFTLPKLPLADPASQKDNLAYLGKVTPSDGASQPHFGPQRLTNGIATRFDHFLGFPTVPEPLEIVIELKKKAPLSRIQIFERAINGSWEKYEVFVSANGKDYTSVGKTEKGTRAETNEVIHQFEAQETKFIKIVTHGCQDLTFPSFSRITEVMAFEK